MQALPNREVHPAAVTAMLAERFADDALSADTLGRIGALEVRLARDAAEVAAAQEVRYRVFYEELGATQAGKQTRLNFQGQRALEPASVGTHGASSVTAEAEAEGTLD